MSGSWPSRGSWTTCYDSSTMANSASTYRSRCDNKGGPTLMLASNSFSGRVYVSGAYTSKSLSTNGYAGDSGAFLFYLEGWPDTPPIKIPAKEPSASNHAIYNGNSGYGPTYGGNHDLRLMMGGSNCVVTIGHSYSYTGSLPSGCSSQNHLQWGQSLFVFERLAVFY